MVAEAAQKRIRVLVVDASRAFAEWLCRGLAEDPEFEVLGSAPDPYEARDMLVRLHPDVITLDLNLPRMHGLVFLEKLRSMMPTPTLVVSAFSESKADEVQECLGAGAWAVVDKNAMRTPASAQAALVELRGMLKTAVAASAKMQAGQRARRTSGLPGLAVQAECARRVIGIGASTGGVPALREILPKLPAWMPAVVVVQHMPAGFTREFAKRMDHLCPMRVVEAEAGSSLQPGQILIAPGGEHHCEVRKDAGALRLSLVKGQPVNGHIPAIDVLFRSMAQQLGGLGIGCLLTGMGEDGARGLLAMRAAGAVTIAQAREGCAVWGMPQAAYQMGACQELVGLQDIAQRFLDVLQGPAQGEPRRLGR